MSKKRLENRITVKDFAEAIKAIEVLEVYSFECGHTESDEFDTDFAHLYTIDEFDSFEIQETAEGKTLLLYKRTWGQCTDCDIFGQINRQDINAEKIYCSDMPRPEGFDSITKYHGLAAYSGTFSPDKAIDNAIDLINNPSWEICCSTRAIGPIGLTISGTVITASNVDLCSSIDIDTGKRFFEVVEDDYRAWKGIIHYADQLKKQWDHDEIVTKDNIVVEVWIKDWALDEFKTHAEKLCKLYNLPLTVIGTEEEYDNDK